MPKVLHRCCRCKQNKLHFLKKNGNTLSICIEDRRKDSLKYYQKKATSPEFLKRLASAKRNRLIGRNLSEEWRNRNPIAYYATMLFAHSKRASKRRGWKHQISKNWIIKKLKVGLCEATKLPFDFSGPKGKHFNPYAPSIDRIDNRVGYTRKNSRCVITWYNMAKYDFTEDEFLSVLKAVSDRIHPK